MKYPIGIQSFEKIIEDGFVYVDKTALIYKLTHEGNIYFLSLHPGKLLPGTEGTLQGTGH